MSTTRILLVEDDPLLRELVEMVLEVEGYSVACADNGAAGLEQAERDAFHLVILDLLMPVMDGMRFLEEFRRSAERRPPVLVLSASTTPDMTDRALRAGAAAVARKPIDQEELLGLVRSLLEREQSEAGTGNAGKSNGGA
ncbi:response regulator [Altericroceibacterium xinjiangense]|uniref:response regulator n=1 Tax=Altericroceibacterium xinjiangense TaxID=762261 RepID=UPI0013DF2146|nr:response regulator [Altericroceibacterium xinjiangense]